MKTTAMKNNVLWILVFSLILLVATAPAAIIKKGQTGAGFLKLDGHARAAAMGSAYMMMGYDASAMFYNPACLGLMEKRIDLMATSTMYIADVKYYHSAAAMRLGNIGTFGLSLVYADYGTIEGTRVAATDAGWVDIGDIEIGAMAAGLAYSKPINDKFTIGGQAKIVNQNLGWNWELDPQEGDTLEIDNKVSGMAFDFGTIYYPGFKSLRFGMSVRNFASEYDFDKFTEAGGGGYYYYDDEGAGGSQEGRFELPLTFTMGVAMDLLDLMGSTEGQSLTLAVDAVHPRDYSERLHLGMEYQFKDLFAVRGGYKFNYDVEGLTLGFGVHVAGIRIDYAYSSLEYFDGLNRFTISYGF